MRKLFRARGLVTPKFIELTGMDQIERCRDMKFPFIVKPTSGFNSDGVQLVANWEELSDAIKHIEHLNAEIYRQVSVYEGQCFARVLVEEYLPGPEYCVELFGLDGDVRALNCGHKGHPTGPCFEETVYLSPPPLPEKTVEEIQATAIQGMLALGLVNGPGHCELRLNENGQPVILEIGARIGGSGCAHFNVEGSTGVDFANLHFSYLAGTEPEKFWPPRGTDTSKAASMWIVPLAGHGVLKGIEGLEGVKKHPDCERILMFAEFGKLYRPYPKFDGFLAMVFAQHESTQAGEAFFDFCEKTIHVNWETSS
jgi:biotin carboxylase